MEMDERLSELLRKALAGGRADRNRFFDELNRMVCASAEVMARKCGLDEYRREEIAQNCLIRILNKLEKSPRELVELENWRNYLYKILRNLAVDELRKLERDKDRFIPFEGRPDDDSGGRPLENLADPHADDRLERETLEKGLSLVRRAAEAIEKERDRQVMLLYLDCHTQQRIAELTGLPVTTVNNIIHKEKKRIIAAGRKRGGQEGIL